MIKQIIHHVKSSLREEPKGLFNRVKNWLIKFTPLNACGNLRSKLFNRVKKDNFWGKVKMFGPVFLFLLAVAGAFYLSFQYFFLADFPIGRDVITHIAHAKKADLQGLFYTFQISLYPLAYVAFVFWHKILVLFGLSWERSFIFFECLNLFVVSLLTGVLSYRIFRDWRMAAVSIVLIASSRWLNDSLRIGLMGESFGWVIFMVALILLFEKKWVWFFLVAIALFFSHPLPFGVLAVIFFGFIVFWMFTLQKEIRSKLILIFALFLVLVISAYFLMPNISHLILVIIKTNFAIEGERGILNFVVDSDRRRLLLYFFSFLGFATIIFNLWKRKFKSVQREKIWLFLIFLFLAFLICFKHYLGIHYLSYRYYTYFEIAAAILAAYAVVYICQISFKKFAFLFYIPLTLLLIYPNYSAIKNITLWQLNTPALQDVLPVGDQKAIPEIAKILKPRTVVYGSSSWHTWLMIDDFGVIGDWSAPKYGKIHNNNDWQKLYQYLLSKNYSYIYFSSIDPIASIEQADFLNKIYDKNGVRVYEVE